MLKRKLSGNVAIGVAVIMVVSFFGLAIAASAYDTREGDPAPNYSFSSTGTLTSGCGIPTDYMVVFNNATAKLKSDLATSLGKPPEVSASLVAAIFSAGEHGGDFPEPANQTWPDNATTHAKGPFQFLTSESTPPGTDWDAYGIDIVTGALGDPQDINDAAYAAARKLDANIKNNSGIVNDPNMTAAVSGFQSGKYSSALRDPTQVKIMKSVYNYNHDFSYVMKVYDAYARFSACNSKSSGTVYANRKEVENLFGTTESEIATHLVSTTFMGKNVTINSVMVDSLKKVEDIVKNSGYPILTVGSYNFRPNVNDTSELSAHSFGLAIDINSISNPNGSRPANSSYRDPGACPHDIPASVAAAFENNGFFWGARYSTVCDPMHFTFGGNWEK